MKSFDSSEVLTTGARGMVGAYVDFGLRPDRHTLDILNEDAVLQYVKAHRPKAILHLAGATDTARCEKEPAYAYELNVRGTYNVASAARSVDAVMVYASTSRVFRGDKSDPYTEVDFPEPETHYGRTKHIGELITQALVPRHIIARTAWVFGGGPGRDNKFFGKILKQLQSNETNVVGLNDVYGSPTYAKDYISAVVELIAKGTYGTFHIANAGVATRFDLAKAMAEKLKSDMQVRAVDRGYFASGATLPTNESISSAKITLRSWEDALTEYVSSEWVQQGA